jgi:hypothetical protein
MKMQIFWGVTPRWLVNINRLFERG